MTAPTELYDLDGSGIMALRIDGPQDTRGKARAFFASEWGLDFTEVKVRRTAYRPDSDHAEEAKADGIPEPYDGWPLVECGDDAPGAAPYWTLDEDCRS
jgi:hypothetical protein